MQRRVMLAVVLGVMVAMACAAAPVFAAATAAPAASAKPAAPAASATPAAPATKAPATTTEDLLAKLTKSEAEIKTFEADIKLTSKAQGMTMTGHMAFQPVMKEGKPAGALMNMKQTMSMGDAGEMSVLMVGDGEFNWTESKIPQMGIMVMKAKPDASKTPSANSQQYREKYDLKLVGTEEFDGQTMWVLEGTLKAPAAAAPKAPAARQQGDADKVRLSIGQKDGFLHRMRGFDKAGTEIQEMQFTNIKINAALDPALFKYTPPAGAQVTDMTQGMPDMSGVMKNLPKGN